VLERAGWTFERIRGSAFYRDREVALEPLWRRLDQLGIPTGDEWLNVPKRTTVREVEGVREPTDPEASSVSAATRVTHGQLGGSFNAETVPTRIAQPAPEQAEHSHGEYLNPDIVGTSILPVSQPDDRPHDPIDRPRPAGLAPFRAWRVRPLPPVDTVSRQVLLGGLVEIVAEEGPAQALRIYQTYVKASGGHRVGREIHRSLSEAVQSGLHSGRLACLHDEIAEQDDMTLYLPGTEPVVVRELGDRQLIEVPRSEVAALYEQLLANGQAGDDVKRAILDRYGLVRMTAGVSKFLDECLEYKFRT
jgi:hypothetical protein